MPSVSISADYLKKQIADLEKVADEIRRARELLVSQYQQLGFQWNDSKYQTLGGIVSESTTSLRNIEKIFLQSQKALLQMLWTATEYENLNLIGTSSASGSTGIADALEGDLAPMIQNEHRRMITLHDAAVEAVKNDVVNGSGNKISSEEAEKLLSGVRNFSGEKSYLIRSAYKNPCAAQCDKDSLYALDCYLQQAPKWNGTVFRGINVSRSTANSILAQESIDMLGPSSWSSEQTVAERFAATGTDSVNIVFVLENNQSGASIAHLATYNGAEREVTAPSGTLYQIERTENISSDGHDYCYVYVNEQ